MEEFEAALRQFMMGHTSIVETKARLLRSFPGTRSQHEALLLADFVEDIALSVRRGFSGIDQAVSDLMEVQLSADDAYQATTVH